MKTSFRNLAAVLALLICAPSSYGQGTLYFGTVDDPVATFGRVNLTTFELEEIADVMEPDGVCCPPDNPVEPLDDVVARFRGMTYNHEDDKLYAAIRGWVRGGDPDLMVMNRATGQVAELIRNNTGPVLSSIAWDPISLTTLYTTNEVLGDSLGTIDLSNSGPGNDVIGGRRSGTLGASIYTSAFDPESGIYYGIGSFFGDPQTLLEIDPINAIVTAEIAVLDDNLPEGFDTFPEAHAMTVRNGDLYVAANSEGSPQEVGDGFFYGGTELWKVSLDGQTVEQLNGQLGRYVDALAWVPVDDPPSCNMAGDANMDCSVTTEDVVQILAGGKFEMDLAATFGEGDFNGDNRFTTDDIVAMLAATLFETGPYAVAALKNPKNAADPGTDEVVVNYDAADGKVSVTAMRPITSISLESDSGIFTGDPAANLGGPFDVDTDVKVFKAVFGGDFSNVEFGAVAAAGLAKDFLLNDLTASGSLAGGGGTFGPDVQLNYIPEPSAFVLLGLGVCGLLGVARRL